MDTASLATIPILIGFCWAVIGLAIQDYAAFDITQRAQDIMFISCTFIIFSMAGLVSIIRQEFMVFEGKPAIIMGIIFMALSWMIALAPILGITF